MTANLDLSLLSIPFQLAFRHCRLGVIELQQAEVSQLDLEGSLVRATKADRLRAIKADSLIVKTNVALRHGFNAQGEVGFPFAQIGGILDCSGGTFTNPPQVDAQGKHVEMSGSALSADGINVRGSVFLGEGFIAHGEVRFPLAQIDGYLDCSGGTFTNPNQKGAQGGGRALNATGINVKGHVMLSKQFTADGGKEFTANGEVNLGGAQIGTLLDCTNGNFENATLDLRDVSAASLWDSGLNDPVGKVTDSAITNITKWPQQCNLLLDGFVYGRISSGGNINAKKRLDWLRLLPGKPFRRQPYLHLAKVLQDSGDSDGALRVRVKMEELSRSSEAGGEPSSKWLNKIIRPIRIGIAWLWSWFLRVSIGYGYYPKRALGFIILLSALGCIVYDRSYYAGTMVPTDEKAYAKFTDPTTEQQVPPHYLSFSSFVYSVENSLPLVKLGQGEKWQPYPGTEAPEWQALFTSRFGTSPRFVRTFLRIQILLGWLFATLFLAGVSGIVHKEKA